MTLLEIALLSGRDRLEMGLPLEGFFEALSADPRIRILPITFEIALEVTALGALRDPADRAIAATARVHRLKLVTSDQRIVDSGLVPVVD
jgi:PIN domain nuclease of toxin-antitoxin system